MPKIETLYVHQNNQCLGRLTKQFNGAIEFQYLNTQNSIPLSMSLPIREEPYQGHLVHSFFENLLPDSKEVLEKIARHTSAQSTTAFDLLGAIGHDCVGALQFTLDKAPIPPTFKSRELSESELAQKLAQLESFPLGMNSETPDFRISIAGAQEKTSFLWRNNGWHIPLGATPSTHIFKPPMGILHNGIDLSDSVENEWLCLQICQQLGLSTAQTEIHKFGTQKCLVIERFDRSTYKQNIIRLPQEDLCQALGIPGHLKYESDHINLDFKRPDANTILNLLNQSDHRRLDREHFFKALIVFYILGATDGHGKNFSIYLTPSQFKLTPLYDVMSVYPALKARQLEVKSFKMAMSIGNNRHYKHTEVCARHFFQTAKKNAIPKNVALNVLENLIETAPHLESQIQLPKDFPEFLAESIFAGVTKTTEKLRSSLREDLT